MNFTKDKAVIKSYQDNKEKSHKIYEQKTNVVAGKYDVRKKSGQTKCPSVMKHYG